MCCTNARETITLIQVLVELFSLLNKNKTKQNKMELIWVCLAAMAVHYKQLDAAQVAFAALRETDKILYIDAIKVIFSRTIFFNR